jgi:hypothetical protein
MQGAIVMLMAMTGLGCQNKPVDSTDLPAVLSAAPASPSPETPTAATTETTTPPPYPRFFFETFPDPEAVYSDPLSAALYSFVFGHDPGIPSAQEIEASALGTGTESGIGTAPGTGTAPGIATEH